MQVRRIMMHRARLILICVASLGGCAQQPADHLPPYRWVNAATAVHDLCERSRGVQTVSAQCALTLTKPDGQSVRLDGAVAMKPPSWLRLRAWKLNQPVLDLTLAPGGLWIESAHDEDQARSASADPAPGPPGGARPEPGGQALPANLSAAKVARAWSVMTGGFFCGETRVYDDGGPSLRVEGQVDEQRVVCEIDRASLTPRRYAVLDAQGVERFSLEVSHYQIVQGTPWAIMLVAHSEGGIIQIELSNVELNAELPPNAFKPPRKARKVS